MMAKDKAHIDRLRHRQETSQAAAGQAKAVEGELDTTKLSTGSQSPSKAADSETWDDRPFRTSGAG
jgi:hypothetical protein